MSNRGRHKKANKHLIVRILGYHVAHRMMQYQKEQGKLPNLDVFLKHPSAGPYQGGFYWATTKEGHEFWDTLLSDTLSNHHLYKKWKNGRS